MVAGKEYFELEGELACVVDGNPDYAITTSGKIWSVRYERYVKPYDNSNGYIQVYLRHDSKRVRKSIHRLVADHFLSNPEGKDEVDHIDRVRSNNHVKNLRWASREENLLNRMFLRISKGKKALTKKKKKA